LSARIRVYAARPGLAECGGAKYHRGRSPNGVLRNPNRPFRAVSSYRLLGEVPFLLCFSRACHKNCVNDH